MKSGIKKAISFALILTLCISSIVAVYSDAADAASVGGALFTDVTGKMDLSSIALKNLSSAVMANASASSTTHTVIVSLEGKNLVEEADGKDVADYIASKEGKQKDAALRKAQDNFLSTLSAYGIDYKLKNRYTVVDNAVAIEMSTSLVSFVKQMSGVASVCYSETYSKPQTVDMGTYATASTEDMDEALKKASAVVNKTSVYDTGVYDSSSVMQKYGYKGGGSVVAIVDTGLDYTHNAFIWDDAHEKAYTLENAAFDKNYIASVIQNDELMAEQKSALNGQVISVNDVYISQKVPFAYDYADNDTDVYPSYSNHGTHVAGIVAGYDPNGYTDKDGNHVDEPFVGVAPEAQLVICKVFTDDLDDPEAGGAETEDILAALEDCIKLGVDVINMSLGTSCGFTTTDDGDDEGEMLNRVYNAVGDAGISLVCAASNDYSAAYGGTFGTNLASNPDSGTVGSPSVFAAALSVASISGQASPYMVANGTTAVYYEESSNQYNKYYDFAKEILGNEDSKEFTYVVVPGVGESSDFEIVANKVRGNIALVKRGNNTFKEKVELAMSYGAVGIIVYNNVSGTVRMALGEIEYPIPSCCISMETGEALAEYANKHGKEGKIVIDKNKKAGPFMSEFSSWGVTPDLKLKPEITAHGGEITSAVPGGYGEQSGTSMASPNMAGVVSIIRSYLKQTNNLSTKELNQRINQLIMSTATLVYDRDNLPYSPRKQGAGLGSLDNAISTGAYLSTNDASIDYRPKVNLGDDPEKVGIYQVTFNIHNFSGNNLTFKVNPIFMTERIASNKLAVAEQAYLLDDNAAEWSVKGDGASKNGSLLTIEAGKEAEVTVTLTLSDAERAYLNNNFENGMYVEGFINLIAQDEGQCSLNLPFMGFYGDWAKIPMLDYDAYEIDKALQDTSIADEDKPQASIWATQPYTTYYNDEYSMPMGSYAYLQDPNADQVYTSMEHNSVSCYDNYYGDDNQNNYLTTYEFRGLYMGLMRGARTIKYSLKNDITGEIIYENVAYRINKAFSGGGSAQPGFLKFELNPLEYGLVSNGKYRMDFEFFCDYGDKDRTKPDDTFSFTFYADYEAPALTDVRVRFQDYEEGNKKKQRIYLDMDVYDNQYTMAALLCYWDGDELNQVTDYVVPFYNCVKNSTNTVSIDITSIYEQYKDKLYVQFDDYALNHSLYYLDLTEATESTAPDSFELADGENKITLDIYETHKVSLVYSGDANLSNFTWGSNPMGIVDVKNGEIVALKSGKTTVSVENANGLVQKIEVTVTDKEKALSLPQISFSTIINSEDKISSGSSVSLYPDQEPTLTIVTDPWYYPKDKLNIRWESTDSSIVDVDQNGKINPIKKGSASIKAIIIDEDGYDVPSLSAVISINVLDPFVVSGYSLSKYRGKDTVVDIPDDEMIMNISEEAFKDNSTMETLIIPKTVINIYKDAFKNCTALKRVYLVEPEEQDIPDADLKLVYRSAFEGCTSLELVDLTNVKVITVAVNAFKGCTALNEIKNMKAIGTAFSGAFDGCTALASIDLTGMQVAGERVFNGCTGINEVLTSKFTDIGAYMFKGCTALESIELNNMVIGVGAFMDCTSLETVKINGVEGESFVIGANAFYNSALESITFEDGCIVREIGNEAFSNTLLTSIVLPEGLTEIGADLFAGTTTLKEITLPATFTFESIKLAGGLLCGVDIKLADESKYSASNGILYSKDMTVLYAVLNPEITSVTIPTSVVEIYDYAFADSRIKRIVIPESVSKIGEGAFKGSTLQKITFNGNSITEIGAYTFSDSSLMLITLPASVMTIGDYAFENSNITSIDLSNVEKIGKYAFTGCDQLSDVTITATTKQIGDYAFNGCSNLDTIRLEAVESIGEGVFIGSGVQTVIFGDSVTSIGEYTFFNISNLKKVVLGSGIEEIGEFAFYGCEALEEVDLGGVKLIDKYAFAECSKLVNIDLSAVEEIGECAFYNCNSLKSVDLSSATLIDTGAFCMDNGKGGVEQVIISAAKEIGASAFEGTSIVTISIPSSLKTLGFGAFAYAYELAEIKVAQNNEIFFVEGGVLYKNLSDGGYELVAYPLAMKATKDTFTVIDNTVRIEAYAFAGLNSNVSDKDVKITKVILPYSLMSIGDSAFYESEIKEYTFLGYNAPTLETLYKAEVEQIMTEHFENMMNPAINSYYYSNFDTLFVNYIDLVGQKSDLIINRPKNGLGYDNFVYTRYFGVHNLDKVAKTDNTKEFLEAMDSLKATNNIEQWKQSASAGDIKTYKKAVEAFATLVKQAREYYVNIGDDADQKAFINNDLETLLASLETEMREVKSSYGIAVNILYLTAEEGSYKKDYIVGETFDMSGIKIVITYDDGSTAYADLAKLNLVTTEALQIYHNDVTIQYTDDNGENYTVWPLISVKKEQVTPPADDNIGDNNDGSNGNDGNIDGADNSVSGGMLALYIVIGIVGAGLIAGVSVVLVLKSKKKKSLDQDANDIEKDNEAND